MATATKGRVYLAGLVSRGGTLSTEAIRANFAVFDRAAEYFEATGWEAYNPPAAAGLLDRLPWVERMKICIRELLDCTAICPLPGWQDSPGARLEVGLARQLSYPFLLFPPGAQNGNVGGGEAPEAAAPALAPPEGSELLPLPFAGHGPLPQRTYQDDAGLDLFVDLTRVGFTTAIDVNGTMYAEVPPHEFLDIPCGLAMGLPAGYWAMIVGRSSTIRRRKLHVANGIIDTGYRGPLFAGVWNLSDESVRVHHGERLAQLLLFPNVTPQFESLRVDELEPSPRGQNGFGSTGR